MNIHNVQFVKSAAHIGQKPSPDWPEVAVVGRSNVGKSSLINALFNRKRLAKTSATPGKTRLLNYFLIDDCMYFVDLPGYGYARLSKKEKEDWKKTIESYLKNNPNLKRVFILLDARHHIFSSDEAMIAWLQHYQIPYSIILTKCDKISRARLNNMKRKLKQIYPAQKIFSFSALKKSGREQILDQLELIVSPSGMSG